MIQTITALVPYLFFQGHCEEVLNFYNQILGGKFNIEERYDNPAMQAPEEYQQKVLHASFEFDGHMMMACDVLPNADTSTQPGNIALSINVKEVTAGKRIFEQLSQEGQVRVKFEKQFWGAWHGNFTDRFGINWMVNCD